MVNCLIKALNNAFKLPRFIVVVPDWDILQHLERQDPELPITSDDIDENIHWIVRKMIEAIEGKRDALFKIKPGSVIFY